jgi:hypothetical protein
VTTAIPLLANGSHVGSWVLVQADFVRADPRLINAELTGNDSVCAVLHDALASPGQT